MRRTLRLWVDETDRIVIVGMPASGKMPLAEDLAELYGLPIRHTDHVDAPWSRVSQIASEWFDEEGGFIACGMALPRALRKWAKRNLDAPRPYSIAIGMWEPRGEITDSQRAMGRGAEKVWREVQAHFSGAKRFEAESLEEAA